MASNIMVDLQLYCIIVSIVCLILFIFNAKKYSKTHDHIHLPLPPSPPALPLIGHLHLISSSICTSFQNLSDRYGPLLYLRMGFSGCLLVSSASVAAEIFRTHDLTFSERPEFAFSDGILFGASGFITAPYGDYWRFVKKLCAQQLLGPRQIERSRALRREELARVLRRVFQSAQRKEVVDIGAELMKYTNNSICRMIMSTRCSDEDSEADKVRELVKESFELITKVSFGDVLGPLKWLTMWMHGNKAKDLNTRYDELLERILKHHEDTRNNNKKNHQNDDDDDDDRDLMDIMLDIYEDEKSEVKITRSNIKAIFLDLFIGGTDTSARTMQWTMAELINNPNVFKKLREEIKSVVGTTRLVQESDVPNLPYLQAVVREAQRLHGSNLTSRLSSQDCNIKGFYVPEKTSVIINLYGIMRDPEFWPHPNEFRPERFLGSSGEVENVGHSTFDFVPFGGGRRGCPGALLAYSMMNCGVAAMVQCFDWNVGDEGGGGKVDTSASGTMKTAHPLMCAPVLHFNPFATV